MKFPDFQTVERYLNSLINYEHVYPMGGARDRPKLDPVLRAVGRLGLPLALPSCVHIAGTKGKGSVVAFLEALLAPDEPTLSFTSPHLVSVRERVRLAGKPLEDQVWQDGFAKIVPALAGDPPVKLTYFESVFIFFLWATRELSTRVHLMEAGLGGRFDATNVIGNTLAVLTPIDYDHTDVLGNTLTEIARDKSGIIKPGAPAVIARQPEEAATELRQAGEAAVAHLVWQGEDYNWQDEIDDAFAYVDDDARVGSIRLAVEGTHQRDNAAVAVRVARTLRPELTADAIRERLSSCVVPARQQFLPGVPEILLDVAHNPVSFRALAETVRRRCAGRTILAVVGMMKNKDARGSLTEIRDLVGDIRVVRLNSPRSFEPEDLAQIARELGMEARCAVSLDAAFAELHEPATHDLGLVAGSFYLAGDYLSWRQRAGIA